MARIKNEPGMVLAAEFDLKSPALAKDLKDFATRLALIQKAQKIASFIVADKTVGNTLTVKIIACATKAAGLSAAQATKTVQAKAGWGPKR